MIFIQKICAILPILASVTGCKTAAKSVLAENEDQRWYQIYVPLNASDKQKSVEAFIAINNAWDAKSIRVDEYSAIPFSGLRKNSAPNGDPEKVTSDPVKTAMEFLRRNQASLRLNDAEIADVEVIPNLEDQNRFRLRSLKPSSYPGFESIQSFSYKVNMEVMISNGAVSSFINRTFLLPEPITIKAEPRLLVDDPKIHDAVIGQVFVYANFAGEEIESPAVTTNNIESTELTVAQRKLDDGSLWVGLVYAVKIKLGALTWTAYVSSETGKLVWVAQDFFT